MVILVIIIFALLFTARCTGLSAGLPPPVNVDNIDGDWIGGNGPESIRLEIKLGRPHSVNGLSVNSTSVSNLTEPVSKNVYKTLRFLYAPDLSATNHQVSCEFYLGLQGNEIVLWRWSQNLDIPSRIEVYHRAK